MTEHQSQAAQAVNPRFPATAGWDPASGNGAPKMDVLLPALTGGGSPPPPPPPPVKTGPTYAQVKALVDEGFMQLYHRVGSANAPKVLWQKARVDQELIGLFLAHGASEADIHPAMTPMAYPPAVLGPHAFNLVGLISQLLQVLTSPQLQQILKLVQELLGGSPTVANAVGEVVHRAALDAATPEAFSLLGFITTIIKTLSSPQLQQLLTIIEALLAAKAGA